MFIYRMWTNCALGAGSKLLLPRSCKKFSFFQSKELKRMSIDRFIWTKLSRVDNEKTKKNLAKLLAIRIRKAEKAERLTS